MHVAYPFRLDARLRTAQAGDADHLRDLIEQLLFTGVGERVNRPSFGTSLRQLVFSPAGEELASAVQQLVHGAVQQWLGELIQVEDVSATAGDGVLEVTVTYLIRRTGQRETASFTGAG
jgi:phage baseplate assembly protein W